ncbi:MAG: pyridoxamine 5'-phosphate oxidase family protein [Defluviitaleaceae bacterium]|nr:pyridoxamine 5'-phosphate oxidase family protein [Defluviitaleaceae bacterium]
MSKAYDFLKECGVFFLATMDGQTPAMRPFGAVMEHDGQLYISTANTKAVYAQMKTHPTVQISAIKPGTREWIRINGQAEEVTDQAIKQKMLDECALGRHFSTSQDPRFAIFKITKAEAWLSQNGQFAKI